MALKHAKRLPCPHGRVFSNYLIIPDVASSDFFNAIPPFTKRTKSGLIRYPSSGVTKLTIFHYSARLLCWYACTQLLCTLVLETERRFHEYKEQGDLPKGSFRETETITLMIVHYPPNELPDRHPLLISVF